MEHFAILGVKMRDEYAMAVISSDEIPAGMKPGDEAELEIDGENADCVLLSIV